MNLAINSKIARNIIVVVINIKTKCLKITKKPSKMSKSQGWWRGWGGCGYYWLISPGFYGQSSKATQGAGFGMQWAGKLIIFDCKNCVIVGFYFSKTQTGSGTKK